MRWQTLATPLTILICVFAFMNFFSWHQQSVYEFEQRQLDLQVNYSVDAATQEMLSEGTHIGTDYIDWGSMTVEPSVALSTYQAVLLRNLGWGDSDQNRIDLMEEYSPFFIVAAYDGYYVYGRQHDIYTETLMDGTKIDNDYYGFHWSPKLPYSFTDGNDVYLYYLSDKEYCKFTMSSVNGTIDSYRPHSYLTKTGNGPTSISHAKAIIAKTLTDATNAALLVGTEGRTDKQFYIPASMSDWTQANPITTPSVLTYVSNPNAINKYSVTTFGIGGAKIDDAQFIICYKVNGNMLYSWADDRELVEQFYADKGMTISIDMIVSTRERASENGYYYDVTFNRRNEA